MKGKLCNEELTFAETKYKVFLKKEEGSSFMRRPTVLSYKTIKRPVIFFRKGTEKEPFLESYKRK